MIKITLELYAAVCVFATIAFVTLAFASIRKSKFDDLESMREFDQHAADRGSEFRFSDRATPHEKILVGLKEQRISPPAQMTGQKRRESCYTDQR